MKEKKVEVSICNSFFSKTQKCTHTKNRKSRNHDTGKQIWFLKKELLKRFLLCMFTPWDFVHSLGSQKYETIDLDKQIIASLHRQVMQCVKLNSGEPCVAVVNSPYRIGFLYWERLIEGLALAYFLRSLQ